MRSADRSGRTLRSDLGNDVVTVHCGASSAVDLVVGYGVDELGRNGSKADADCAKWRCRLFEVAVDRGGDHGIVKGEQRRCCFERSVERGPLPLVVGVEDCLLQRVERGGVTGEDPDAGERRPIPD